MRRGGRKPLPAGLAAAALLAPWAAWACPYCAARADNTHRTLFFIAAMCLLPFLVGGAALLVIRRMDSEPKPGE